MSKKWSFSEEYIVCKFSYGHMSSVISQQEILFLMSTLKQRGYSSRSESCLRAKVKIYQNSFAGIDSPYATNQMRRVSDVFIKRLVEPEYYIELDECIKQLSLSATDETVSDMATYCIFDTGMHHLIALEPRALAFKEVLMAFIERSGMKDSQVYKNALVSRDKFNHIFNPRRGKNVNSNNRNNVGVSRRTIIQLCIGLELTYEDATMLMESAGLTFLKNDDTERVVVAFLKKGNYTMEDINMELDDRGLQAFSESRYDAM